MAGLLPELTPENTDFWTGGGVGELRIMACDACDHRIHPPQLICPKCLSRRVRPRVASGRATIHTYTINHQAWVPGLVVPYALAIVDLDDQPGVRMTVRVETESLDAVQIDAPVRIDFEARDDVFIPFARLI